jgi:hypothetical protein
MMLQGPQRDAGPLGGEPGRGPGITTLGQKFDCGFEQRLAGRCGPVYLLSLGLFDRPNIAQRPVS